MDRARGKFSKGSSNSPRSDGQSPRPTTSRGQGSSSSNSPTNTGGEGKRGRESPDDPNRQRGKRIRAEPAHGQVKRKPRFDLDHTKPEGIVKSGHGTEFAREQQTVRLKANYFNLTNKKQFFVYQYHVVIEPKVEMNSTKKGIFYDCTTQIRCNKIFDGETLYTTQKLDNDVIVVNGTRRGKDSETPVTVTIKFVKEVTSFQELPMFQVLNTVMRQALQGLRLQLVGRNFFDSHASNAIHALRVEVWPGYITSIRQHDGNLLMCCETTSKVMRNETLYQILKRCKDNHQDYKTAYKHEVLGITVLTDYNNKTYRVDDVDWDNNPESTFETKTGPKSYLQYYRDVSIKSNTYHSFQRRMIYL